MKNHSRLMAAAALATVIVGCGKQDEEPGSDEPAAAPLPTAATLGVPTVLSEAEHLAAEPYASADRANGERQAALCKACHSLDKDGPHMIGPALNGFFGDKVGAQPGFDYSSVMRDADFTWTPAALDAWLMQPGRFLPGNRMAFAGVPDQGDRNDVIAYLLAATSSDAQ